MPEGDDLREFIREMLLRFDATAERLHRQVMSEIALQREESRRHFAEQQRKTDDLIAENRAQRAALFRILDRLDGGPATAG